MQNRRASTNGPKRAYSLMQSQIRSVSESRGFAETRVITHWADIVGDAIAALCRPVDVKFPQHGLGATLTVLTTGAQAPMLEMQKEDIRARVNAIYGYNAIGKIRITQTAPVGFAEGQAQFTPAPKRKPAPIPAVETETQTMTGTVQDENLRRALADLARNVLTKEKTQLQRKG